MITCPKCRSQDIMRPIYVRALDVLRYHCRNCGYSEDRLPADRQQTLTKTEHHGRACGRHECAMCKAKSATLEIRHV